MQGSRGFGINFKASPRPSSHGVGRPLADVPGSLRPSNLIISRAEAGKLLRARALTGYRLTLPPAARNQQERASYLSSELEWFSYTKELLSRIFDNERYALEYAAPVEEPYDDPEDLREEFHNARARIKERVVRLQLLIKALPLIAEPATNRNDANVPWVPPSPGDSKRVFLVHGHDVAAKESVARLCQKLGIEVVILHEKPDEGRTIIEKFEAHSDVAFAIVLLTPDDYGASASAPSGRPRARQNVLLEMGFFIGKLGRRRVCVLYGPGVEIPSDYSGVLYVPLDPAGAWRILLAKELKATGLPVDLNLV